MTRMRRPTIPIFLAAALFSAVVAMDMTGLTTVAPALEAAGQSKGKPPADRPGVLTFRCPSGLDCSDMDAILGDGEEYPGTSNTRVVLNSNSEMRMELLDASRSVTADFSSQAPGDVAPCALSGPACRYWNAWTAGDRIFTLSGGPSVDGVLAVLMQTNVVDDNGNELAGGLLALAEGQTRNSRFSISFQDPDGRDMHWVIRYYPELYTGSSYVTVTRTDACTWRIGAAPDASGDGARGGLLVHDHKLRGKNGNRVDHGLFDLPFELTFSVPSLCPAA